MKKEFKNKKKLIVIGLAALCCCLTVGLIYFLGGMGGKIPATIPESEAQEDSSVSVTTIFPVASVAQSTSAPSAPVEITPPNDTGTSERPTSPEDAVPPAPPTVEDESAATNPAQPPEYTPAQTQPSAQPSTPQGGETNGNGDIWVPGFGWVPNEGRNTQGTAPNAGTGDPVGDM